MMDELDDMVSPKTKLIFVCSPNNPSGAVFQEAEMRRICEIARENDAYLLSDEVYRGLEWDAPLSPSAVNYYEKAISGSSVSKCLGLQGIRTGWMATQDKELLFKCLILREDTSEVMNVLGEHIALAALKPGKRRMGGGGFVGFVIPDVEPDSRRPGKIRTGKPFDPVMKLRDRLKPGSVVPGRVR